MKLLALFKRGDQQGRPHAIRALVRKLFGFYPLHTELFEVALRHRSVLGSKEGEGLQSNERLEFLGDAILGAMVADYLYEHYPNEDEGALTKMRSSLVNRTTLNAIADNAGIVDVLQYVMGRGQSLEKLGGNALEAMIGALYLYKGYAFAKKKTFRFLEKGGYLQSSFYSPTDYKSHLYELAQMHKMEIVFNYAEEEDPQRKKVFTSLLNINGALAGRGTGTSKKKASQAAAREALENLNTAK